MAIPGVNVAATGMHAEQHRMQEIANNLANASSIGFKGEQAVFQSLMYQQVREPDAAAGGSVTGVYSGTGVKIAGVAKDYSQGSLQITNGSLDVAISGDGFIPIVKDDGAEYYTRDGQLKRNAEGQIVTLQGYQLAADITVPDEAEDILIDPNGTVKAMIPGDPFPQILGEIELVRFQNPQGLKPLAGNLYQSTAASGSGVYGMAGTDGFGDIMQGALEASNVDTVTNLVKLIEVQRNFELNTKVMKAADEMAQYANQQLG